MIHRKARLHTAGRAVVVVGLLGLADAGCFDCNDIGCVGGFAWTARAADGEALEPGSYGVEITLEGTVFTAECTIAETSGGCSEPIRIDGERDFFVSARVSGPSTGVAPNAIHLRASDKSDSDARDLHSATRGPEQVHVLVQRAGESLIDVDYELTYVRDEAYRGDERCGYCDELQTREVEIEQGDARGVTGSPEDHETRARRSSGA